MKGSDLGHLAHLFPCNPCVTNCNCSQMAMKCADLGHLASIKSVHLKWVHALEEGALEKGGCSAGDMETEEEGVMPKVTPVSNSPT